MVDQGGTAGRVKLSAEEKMAEKQDFVAAVAEVGRIVGVSNAEIARAAFDVTPSQLHHWGNEEKVNLPREGWRITLAGYLRRMLGQKITDGESLLRRLDPSGATQG